MSFQLQRKSLSDDNNHCDDGLAASSPRLASVMAMCNKVRLQVIKYYCNAVRRHMAASCIIMQFAKKSTLYSTHLIRVAISG